LRSTKQTYSHWRRKYRSLRVDQIRCPNDLEGENARVEKLGAYQALELAILKEDSSGDY